MQPQRTISAIGWDLDNTLIDRDAALRSFFVDWLGQRVAAPDADTLLRLICAEDRSGEGDRLEFCARVLGHCRLPQSLAGDLWTELQRELPSRITLDARIARMLDTLSEAYPMFIVSNGGSEMQRAKIRHAGLERWFGADRVFVSSEVGANKPERAIFDFAVASIAAAPAEVLFVGDNPVNDICGANACGMQTCWVSLDRVRPESLPADFVVRRAWEIETLLSTGAVLVNS